MEREGRAKSKFNILWILAAVVFIAIVGQIAYRMPWKVVDTENDPDAAYGFSGKLMKFGEQDHEIYFGNGVDLPVVVAMGEYLGRIGYFSPSYGGVIQFRKDAEGYEVYLTYSKSYWDRDDFQSEVRAMRDDMEANILQAPTRIILVDEDEKGVHTRRLTDH